MKFFPWTWYIFLVKSVYFSSDNWINGKREWIVVLWQESKSCPQKNQMWPQPWNDFQWKGWDSKVTETENFSENGTELIQGRRTNWKWTRPLIINLKLISRRRRRKNWKWTKPGTPHRSLAPSSVFSAEGSSHIQGIGFLKMQYFPLQYPQKYLRKKPEKYREHLHHHHGVFYHQQVLHTS